MSLLRQVKNSIIFICLPPNLKWGHLKFIELESPPLGDPADQLLLGECSKLKVYLGEGNL